MKNNEKNDKLLYFLACFSTGIVAITLVILFSLGIVYTVSQIKQKLHEGILAEKIRNELSININKINYK